MKLGPTTLTDTITEWDIIPLVPVTFTLYVPAVDELTVSVAVPDPPGIKVGLTPAVRPGVGTGESVTVPVNPLRAVTVIVDVPEAPARIWAGLTAPAAMV